MNSVEKCPRCGAPVSGQRMGGLCRRCVKKSLFGGLKEFDDDLPPIQAEPSQPGPTSFAPANQPDEAVGQMIGRYKLREKIGEGGGGVVYVAEQTEPVRRKIALKLIKLGMDTRQVIARFEAERQALAMMDLRTSPEFLTLEPQSPDGPTSSWNWSPESRLRISATRTG